MANTYKDTMILPSTEFPMRAGLPKSEPKRLEKWEAMDIYNKVLEKNKTAGNGQTFILHDGPPYANGPIHIGHAFNKVLKDFVVKSHAQRGYYSPYVPGWDCHGQPIEHMVEQTLGSEKFHNTPQPEVRRLCREWAEKYVGVQREGFKRLGVNGEWDNPYLTYVPEYEAGNVEIFKKIYLDGAIYRGRKPIHWCIQCHTALAEAEIEYGDEVSPSIYVNFKLDAVPAAWAAAGVEGPVNVLIWTTTPWTLPANGAVALAPQAHYVVVNANGTYELLALELLEEVAQIAGWESAEPVRDGAGEIITVKGTELAGATYTCPIRQDLKGTLIYGDHVTLDTGTGAVHTAPGHGQDDYYVGLEFGIPVLMPVDDDGNFTSEGGPFAGMNVNDANPKIIEWLREQGTLVAGLNISHSYPHCWRCHEPVIFRATDQWFVSMEDTGLREGALKAIREEVRWIPEWAANRIGSMVAERPDWCISRQRSWGVPIPVFRCTECGEVVATEETFDAVIELFRTKGADAWFTDEPETYLPAGTACACGCTKLAPEKDILDVWWESGVSHTSVCEARDYLYRPADMYLEGSDQHRGWFQSSLLTSVAAYGIPPYKSVMHCGFTVDAEGRKMSKSLGNGVDPAEVIEQFGADVLRLWVASVDYSQDVRISDEILKYTADSYRRFRNTFRFLLGSLTDFSNEVAVKDFAQLELLDQWAMVRLQQLVAEVEAGYENYKYHHVFRALYEYTGDLSSVYLDPLKDRLYAEAPDSPARRSAQTVLANILEVLVRVLAPILSFTTEEVWEHYPEGMRGEGYVESVQLAGWPKPADYVPVMPEGAAEQLNAKFAPVLELRDVVTKAIEDARNAGTLKKSQEAAVSVVAPAEMLQALSTFDQAFFNEIFIVASVEFEEGAKLSATVAATEMEKCPRCWNHRPLGGTTHASVCERCGNVLDAIGFEG